MIKSISLVIVIALLMILTSSFVLAADQVMDMNIEMSHEMNMGPMLGGVMIHGWISLLAAIVIFILALKFMTGGTLSRPIMLMGFGALADAIIGIFPGHDGHMQNMWLGSLLFSLSVVLGIVWMAKIFGAFKSNKH